MSKYSTATIDAAHVDGGDLHTIDLEGKTLSDLCAELRELIPARIDEEVRADEDHDPESIPGHVNLTSPKGFARHLFTSGKTSPRLPVDNCADILEKWNDETDEDRREAMGEYMDDMGADDLSDFDEAYQGQFDSGADFAEDTAKEVGDIPKDLPSWIVIDWEASWERNLRHDYHMTKSGHTFRNL